MKQVTLEIHLPTLDPSTSSAMQEMQVFQHDIMEAGKDITSEDMAITLLIQLHSRAL